MVVKVERFEPQIYEKGSIILSEMYLIDNKEFEISTVSATISGVSLTTDIEINGSKKNLINIKVDTSAMVVNTYTVKITVVTADGETYVFNEDIEVIDTS